MLEVRNLLSTYTVDHLTDDLVGEWLNGSLRYCITHAADGDDITFGDGVAGTINLTGALPDLTHSIRIEGPGRDQLTVRRDTGGNYRIFTVGSGTTVTIDGLTMANGRVVERLAKGGGIYNDGTLTVSNSTLSSNGTDPISDAYGGGIYNAGTLTVDDSTLSNNINRANGDFSSAFGGGIFNTGTLMVSNSTLSSNETAVGGCFDDCGLAYGGGIYSDVAATVTITASTLSGNHSGSFIDAVGGGGGISNSGTLTVTDSTLSGNIAATGGGGIRNDRRTVTITDSTLSGNSGSDGGGIFNGGTLTVTASTLNGNFVRSYGGGISNSGTLTVTDSTLSGNSAGTGGGGIFSGLAATVTITASTLSRNSANQGGGILNISPLIVSNSTISGNTASGHSTAGGIGNIASDVTVLLLNCTISNNTVTGSDATGTQLFSGRLGGSGNAIIQLRNTIISGDGSRPNVFADTNGTFVSQGHNLSSDDGSGFLTGDGDLTNVDPLLGPLQDNGGPTWTMALLPGSPAIDAGDNTDAPDWDQRGPGFPRIVGIIDPDNPIIDIGAFEVQSAKGAPPGTSPGSDKVRHIRGHSLELDAAIILFSEASPVPYRTRSVEREMALPVPNPPADLAPVDQFFSPVWERDQLLSVAWSNDRRIDMWEDSCAVFMPNNGIVEGWIFRAPNWAS
jgi:hypothetical protein